jgi:NADH:ubiquinone oxidoreductase subunit
MFAKYFYTFVVFVFLMLNQKLHANTYSKDTLPSISTLLFENFETLNKELKKLPASKFYILGYHEIIGVHTIQRWGLLNEQKKILLPYDYDTIIPASSNEFIIKKHFVTQGQSKQVYGLYHANQFQMLLEPIYSKIQPVHSSLYLIQKKGTQQLFQSTIKAYTHPFENYKFIDSTAVEIETQQIKSFYTTKNLKCIKTNYKNVELKTHEYIFTFYGTFDLFDAAQHKIVTKNVFADSIIPSNNQNWIIYRNGFSFMRHNYAQPTLMKNNDSKSKKNYSIDTIVSNIIRYVSLMDSIYYESSGLFLVSKEGLYGYCDSVGNTPIAPKYDSLSEWSEGYCAVQFRKKWGYLDNNENLVVQPYFTNYFPFSFGAARVKEGKQWMFINKQGKNINSVVYDTIIPNFQGNYIVIKNKKMGICSPYGRELIPCIYNQIIDLGFDNFVIQHYEHKKVGIINAERSTIVPSNYHAFSTIPNYSCVWLFTPNLNLSVLNKVYE